MIIRTFGFKYANFEMSVVDARIIPNVRTRELILSTPEFSKIVNIAGKILCEDKIVNIGCLFGRERSVLVGEAVRNTIGGVWVSKKLGNSVVQWEMIRRP